MVFRLPGPPDPGEDIQQPELADAGEHVGYPPPDHVFLFNVFNTFSGAVEIPEFKIRTLINRRKYCDTAGYVVEEFPEPAFTLPERRFHPLSIRNIDTNTAHP